jgi:uncharacterized protein YcsI (UPF0317 family)
VSATRDASMTGREIRALCRSGSFDRPTAGVAIRFAQANLVILPSNLAGDFKAFCEANAQPCPVLEMCARGSFEPKTTAPGADLRTDLPRYRVYRDGALIDQPRSIERYWPDDPKEPDDRLTALLIGCSFTFERALLDDGVPVRHLETGCNVPMYRTNIACAPAGAFHGPMVVSMRPMTPEQAVRARRVTERYPRVHGAPVHVGNPSAIGIGRLDAPDYGDPVPVRAGEVPVFWACGVTPMEAIMRAAPPIAITHEPGHMFVTDLLDESLRDGDGADG